MKQKLTFAMLLLAVLFGTSCKEEVLAPDISGMETTEYLLNIGDKVTLAPSVKNLKGNTYSWWINGKKVSNASLSYTFEARQPGTFTLVFKAENKSGLAEQAFKLVVEEPLNIVFEGIFTTPNCQVLEIAPRITGPQRDDYTYEWIVDNSVIGNKPTLDFIAIEPGNYKLQLTVKAGKQSKTTECIVSVEGKQYRTFPTSLVGYQPSMGNTWNFPLYISDEEWVPFTYSPSELLKEVTKYMQEKRSFTTFDLGTWGGYAEFGFDHTIANIPEKDDIFLWIKDYYVTQPAFFVAYDKNKNGKPDEDEWYEIKLPYFDQKHKQNYQCTYTYKDYNPETYQINYEWQDNEGGKGESSGYQFPGYYWNETWDKVLKHPGWNSTFTLKGRRIEKRLDRGMPARITFRININNAVDKNGEPVFLPGIDFLRVQNIGVTYWGNATTPMENSQKIEAIHDIHIYPYEFN